MKRFGQDNVRNYNGIYDGKKEKEILIEDIIVDASIPQIPSLSRIDFKDLKEIRGGIKTIPFVFEQYSKDKSTEIQNIELKGSLIASIFINDTMMINKVNVRFFPDYFEISGLDLAAIIKVKILPDQQFQIDFNLDFENRTMNLIKKTINLIQAFNISKEITIISLDQKINQKIPMGEIEIDESYIELINNISEICFYYSVEIIYNYPLSDKEYQLYQILYHLMENEEVEINNNIEIEGLDKTVFDNLCKESNRSRFINLGYPKKVKFMNSYLNLHKMLNIKVIKSNSIEYDDSLKTIKLNSDKIVIEKRNE